MYQIQIIGNLTRDAGVKNFNGSNFIEGSVAVNRKVNGTEYTDYIDFTLTSDRGTIFPYLTKGKKIFIQGLPRMRAYISDRDRQPHASMSVMVDRIELLGSSSDNQAGQSNNNSPQTSNQQGNDGGIF